MASTASVAESTLTDRYQTTVPSSVRQALRLGKRDRICYAIQSDGNVLLSRAEQKETDPVLESFLTFLAHDMQHHPQRLTVVTPALVARLQHLVSNIDIDLDAPLEHEDE